VKEIEAANDPPNWEKRNTDFSVSHQLKPSFDLCHRAAGRERFLDADHEQFRWREEGNIFKASKRDMFWWDCSPVRDAIRLNSGYDRLRPSGTQKCRLPSWLTAD
jgi:hypothetical protein